MPRWTKSVLIVEDTDVELFRLRQALRFEGYQVVEAGTPAEAIASVESEADAPALVLLDLGVSDAAGEPTLLSRILAIPESSQPTVVLLADEAQRAEAVRAVRAGAADFLQRPFTDADLLLTVRGALTGVQPKHAPIPHSSSELLQVIRRDLASHHYAHARRIFEESAHFVGGEAAYFNLLGVLSEAEGNHKGARAFYRKAAVWTGTSASAARHNLTRLDDIEARGESSAEVHLGDEHERNAVGGRIEPPEGGHKSLLDRLLGR